MITNARWLLAYDDDETEEYPTSVTINMALGVALATIADIEVNWLSGPPPPINTGVRLRYGDLDAEVAWPIFIGEVIGTLGASDPQRVTLRCSGRLYRLNDVWDGDEDFDGHSGKFINTTALTASGIVFDSALLQDDDLSLGALAPVVGTNDTARSGIVQEVNRLLGMALVEIYGEVHRFYYNTWPSTADIIATFERAVSPDLDDSSQTLGEKGDIVNRWKVTGTSYECGPKDACRCTIWAKAFAPNDVLGSGYKVERDGESSDLIDNTDWAEWIASERMKATNRVPNRISIGAFFNPDIHVGDVVGVIDTMAGIAITEEAAYLVERMDVRDHMVTYGLVGGDPGDDGTITSGVEKRCNKATSNGPGPTGFTPPGPWPRIFVTPEDWHPAEDGGSGGFFDCMVASEHVDWEDEFGPFNAAVSSQVSIPVDGAIESIGGGQSVATFAHDSHFHFECDISWVASDDWGMNLLLTTVTGDPLQVTFSSATGDIELLIGATLVPVVATVTSIGSVHLELVYNGEDNTATLTINTTPYVISTVGMGTGPHHIYLEAFEDTGDGLGTVNFTMTNIRWLFGTCD